MKRVIRSELKKRLSNQVPSVWSETAFHIHKQGRVPQRTWWWQSLRLERCTSLLPTSCPMTQQSLLGQNVLNIEDTRSHTTPQSVGLPWTSDRPDTETSTWQHTTLTRDKHPCPRRDSYPQSQQASGRRPTSIDRPATGPVEVLDTQHKILWLLLFLYESFMIFIFTDYPDIWACGKIDGMVSFRLNNDYIWVRPENWTGLSCYNVSLPPVWLSSAVTAGGFLISSLLRQSLKLTPNIDLRNLTG